MGYLKFFYRPATRASLVPGEVFSNEKGDWEVVGDKSGILVINNTPNAINIKTYNGDDPSCWVAATESSMPARSQRVIKISPGPSPGSFGALFNLIDRTSLKIRINDGGPQRFQAGGVTLADWTEIWNQPKGLLKGLPLTP